MLLRSFALVVALALPIQCWAAIAFVSQTDATATANVSSVTFSQVVGAGSDRALVVCSGARVSGTTVRPITNITFAGAQSFTKIRADAEADANGGIGTEIWYLLSPTVTTGNIVVTYNGLNESAIGVSSTLFTGVSAIDSHAGSKGTGTTLSAILTTIADNAAIVDCAYGKGDTGLTVGAGQTMRTDRLLPTVNDGAGISTVIPKTPAGAETMDWTHASAFDWTLSAVSLTPSGGSDPNPTVPTQVTLGWTNGTDSGANATGIVTTTIQRCQGSGCNATTAPAIGTRSFPTTSFIDQTVGTNTTYGYSVFHTDGAGNPSTKHTTVYMTTTGAPGAPVPKIINAVTDATGSTLTYDVTTPTKIKVVTFTSSQTISSVEHPIADFPSGRFTQTWAAGLQGVCFSAIDVAGVENTVDTQCDNLTGIVGPIDTTPPVLTCPSSVTLPAGTTSYEFSCNVDKSSNGKWDTTDVAFASMANDLALNSLTFSATKGSLTNGSSTPVYMRAAITDINDVTYPMTSSKVVTLIVEASTADTTPPGNVANLTATLLGTTVTLAWNAAADAVSYQVYQAQGDCSTFAPAGSPVGTTSTQASLQFNTVYCWKIKALDIVNNFSTNFSNEVTKTTPVAPDVQPPTAPSNLAALPFVNSIQLTWANGSDNSGSVYTNVERCQVATGQQDCANFSVLVSEIVEMALSASLTAGTRYCFRVQNGDPSGNVSSYSEAVCETTGTIGVGTPHTPLRLGTVRPDAVRTDAGTRPNKP